MAKCTNEGIYIYIYGNIYVEGLLEMWLSHSFNRMIIAIFFATINIDLAKHSHFFLCHDLNILVPTGDWIPTK